MFKELFSHILIHIQTWIHLFLTTAQWHRLVNSPIYKWGTWGIERLNYCPNEEWQNQDSRPDNLSPDLCTYLYMNCFSNSLMTFVGLVSTSGSVCLHRYHYRDLRKGDLRNRNFKHCGEEEGRCFKQAFQIPWKTHMVPNVISAIVEKA